MFDFRYLKEKDNDFNMRLCISGTPGVGKSTVSEKLSENLGWKLFQVNEIAKKLDAFQGEDPLRDSKILDMEKIKSEIHKIGGDLILEGHVAHEIPCDVVIVLRCNPDILEKRLEERYTNKPEKVAENVNAEILGVITSEAIRANDDVYEIDVSCKSVGEIIADIQNIIHGKVGDYEVGKVDWLEKYDRRLI